LQAKFVKLRALALATFGREKESRIVLDHGHCANRISAFQRNSTDVARRPALIAPIRLMKADGHAKGSNHDGVIGAVRQNRLDQRIALIDLKVYYAAAANIFVGFETCLFYKGFCLQIIRYLSSENF
jgi:hypothetical protein